MHAINEPVSAWPLHESEGEEGEHMTSPFFPHSLTPTMICENFAHNQAIPNNCFHVLWTGGGRIKIAHRLREKSYLFDYFGYSPGIKCKLILSKELCSERPV